MFQRSWVRIPALYTGWTFGWTTFQVIDLNVVQQKSLHLDRPLRFSWNVTFSESRGISLGHQHYPWHVCHNINRLRFSCFVTWKCLCKGFLCLAQLSDCDVIHQSPRNGLSGFIRLGWALNYRPIWLLLLSYIYNPLLPRSLSMKLMTIT